MTAFRKWLAFQEGYHFPNPRRAQLFRVVHRALSKVTT